MRNSKVQDKVLLFLKGGPATTATIANGCNMTGGATTNAIYRLRLLGLVTGYGKKGSMVWSTVKGKAIPIVPPNTPGRMLPTQLPLPDHKDRWARFLVEAYELGFVTIAIPHK